MYPVRQCDNPTKEEVIEYQQRYFKALEELFERYKHEAGHSDYTIGWKD